MIEAAEQVAESKFKEILAQIAEQQQSGQLWMNLLLLGQQQSGQLVAMPPPVCAQANTTCAQSSVASTTAQPFSVDSITCTTPCMLLYPIGRAGKTKEVAKGARGSFLGFIRGKTNPTSICMRASAGVIKIKLCGK